MAKSPEAFRTISEAAEELGVPQHVLRHWEEVFGQVRPMRRAGGRRYYRPLDIDLLRGVRVLLYDQRYTTKGVQKIFKENGVKYVSEIGRRTAAGETVDMRPTIPEDGARAEGDDAHKDEVLE
ncbi:MAG: MerR family transcriptional regulator [Pseudomonadota bacterium]